MGESILHNLTLLVASWGTTGVFVFLGLYVFSVLLIPGSPFAALAGVAYGFPLGLLLAIVGDMIGASLAFFLGRYFVRNRVIKFIEKKPNVKVVSQAIDQAGWKFVVLLRLSPVIPFIFQNYFLGTTNVSFKAYVLATFVGILPLAVLFVSVGSLGLDAASSGSSIQLISLVMGILITTFVLWTIGKKAQKLLESARAS